MRQEDSYHVLTTVGKWIDKAPLVNPCQLVSSLLLGLDKASFFEFYQPFHRCSDDLTRLLLFSLVNSFLGAVGTLQYTSCYVFFIHFPTVVGT